MSTAFGRISYDERHKDWQDEIDRLTKERDDAADEVKRLMAAAYRGGLDAGASQMRERAAAVALAKGGDYASRAAALIRELSLEEENK